MRDFRFHHIAAPDSREIIGGLPFFWIELPVGTQLACLESLEQDRLISEKVDAQLIEILRSPAKRQIGAPIVGISGQGDKAARLKIAHHIGAGPNGGLGQPGGCKILARPLVLFQDRAQTRDQGQLAILCIEGQLYAAGAGLFDPFDLGPEATVAQMPFGTEGLIGPDDILDRDGAAIGKPGLRAQSELHP